MNDNDIKRCVEAFVPSAPEGYEKRVESTVSELKARRVKRGAERRPAWKPIAAAACAVLALFVAAAAVFGARPALAADVPIVNDLVYAASPARTASEADRAEIEALLDEAFGAFNRGDYEYASRCFRDGCMGTRENYLAAAYLYYLLWFGDSLTDGAEAGGIELTELSAERRAYRYTTEAAFGLVSRDGSKKSSEPCTVEIWENRSGKHIESIRMQSPEYESFVSTYEAKFGAVPENDPGFGMITVNISCMSYENAVYGVGEKVYHRAEYLNLVLARLDCVSASPEEKAASYDFLRAELEKAEGEIVPAAVTAEETAVELMYRYWLGRQEGEVSDFSDIVERNEDTDLFLWDAQLQAEKVSLRVLPPLTTVEKAWNDHDRAEVIEVREETDEMFKALIHVHTNISDGVMQGVGEEIVLTLRRNETGYTVIGFDRETGDGSWFDLKAAAERYKAGGYSWQEAGRMAYEEMHERLVKDAEYLAEH